MTDEDLQSVYRSLVLEHSREPHNFGAPAQHDRSAAGHNPLCGDEVTVYLSIEGDRVNHVCFDGCGCAISMASASMMTDALKGLDCESAGRLIDDAEALFSGDGEARGHLAELSALQGVRAYPSRIKCALLPWKTVAAALNNQSDTISTEKG